MNPLYAYTIPTYVSNYKLNMWDDSFMPWLRARIQWTLDSTMWVIKFTHNLEFNGLKSSQYQTFKIQNQNKWDGRIHYQNEIQILVVKSMKTKFKCVHSNATTQVTTYNLQNTGGFGN